MPCVQCHVRLKCRDGLTDLHNNHFDTNDVDLYAYVQA